MDANATSSARAEGSAPKSGEFKGFFLSLLMFLAFAAVIYVLMVCAWGLSLSRTKKQSKTTIGLVLLETARNLRYPIGGTGYMLREVKHTRDVDILVIGSSHANRGFDPRIFARAGYKMFNMGSSGQTHVQTRILLRRYLDRLNPGVILYEVFPNTFNVDGVESALDIIANDRNDLSSIRMALLLNHPKVYNALIYGFFRDLFHLNPASVTSVKVIGGDTYVSGGYFEKGPRRFKESALDNLPARWRIRKSQLKAFEDNLSMIRERNIRLVLVQAPWTRGRYLRFQDRAAYDEKMRSYGEYYNFNKLLIMNDRLHFYDWHHMNQRGVEIFNRALIRRVFTEGRMAEKGTAGA